MNAKHEKRLAAAKNPHLRKHHRKPTGKRKFKRPTSHVGLFLEEVGEDLRSKHPSINGYDNPLYSRRLDLLHASAAPVVMAAGLGIAAAQDGLEAINNFRNRKKRKASLERRRKYYAAENKKRREDRAAIRAAIPKPTNGLPTEQQLFEAYCRRHESDEWALRFGGLILDIEENFRREYHVDGNRFTGSAKGVKEWLRENCPLLAEHYQTCQRYKRIAQDEPDAEEDASMDSAT